PVIIESTLPIVLWSNLALQPPNEVISVTLGIEDTVCRFNETIAHPWSAGAAQAQINAERIVLISPRHSDVRCFDGRNWGRRQLPFRIVVGVQKRAEKLQVLFKQIVIEIRKEVPALRGLNRMHAEQQ